MKILLVRLDHLGDLILSTPLIRALAKAGHQVDVIIPQWLVGVLQGNPHVQHIYPFEQVNSGWWGLGRWMRGQGYDGILLPNPKPRSLFFSSLISGSRRRLAMQAGTLGRITGHHCLPVGQALLSGRHFADIQLDLARALDVPTDGIKTDYFTNADEIQRAQQNIQVIFRGINDEPLIGIHPGTQGNTCNLPSSVYGELASLILKRTHARVVITGSAGERDLLKSWPSDVLKSPRVYTSMGCLDLRMLAAVISQMSAYIIGSTGPLHLASALGIQTTSPFCALTPLNFSVWGNSAGTGACVEPDAKSCRRWTSQAAAHQHCNLRGEVTAENLWACLSRQKTIPL